MSKDSVKVQRGWVKKANQMIAKHVFAKKKKKRKDLKT